MFDLNYHLEMKKSYEGYCKTNKFRPEKESELGMWFNRMNSLIITDKTQSSSDGYDVWKDKEFVKELDEWILYVKETYDTALVFERKQNMISYEIFCVNEKHRPSLKCPKTDEELRLAEWFHSLNKNLTTNYKDPDVFLNIQEWCKGIKKKYPTFSRSNSYNKYLKLKKEFEAFCNVKDFRPSKHSTIKHERKLANWILELERSLKRSKDGLLSEHADEVKSWICSMYNNYPNSKFYYAYYNGDIKANNNFFKVNSKVLGTSVEKARDIPCSEMWHDIQVLKGRIKHLEKTPVSTETTTTETTT